jgi:predicted RNase H-like nuclease (RuvC/YqgF family)
LKNEIAKLKRSPETSKVTDNDDSVYALRAKVEKLQIMCLEQEARNKELEENTKHLQKQLDSARSLLHKGGAGSTRSMSSGDTSLSDLDVVRLRKELAEKIGRIVLLEFDLEMCRDELHSLQHGSRSNGLYPSRPSDAQNTADVEDNYYSREDDEDDDDDWR